MGSESVFTAQARTLKRTTNPILSSVLDRRYLYDAGALEEGFSNEKGEQNFRLTRPIFIQIE